MKDTTVSICRKVMLIKKEPISKEGLRMWKEKARNKIHKFVYKSRGSFLMPYEVCEDRNRLAEWIFEQVGEGVVYLMSWRKGYYKKRSPERLRPYRLAILENRLVNDELVHIFHNLDRIRNFQWFERDRKLRKAKNFEQF